MTTLAIGLVNIDADATSVEAASKRVRLVAIQGSTIALTAVGCAHAKRAQHRMNRLRAALSNARITTTEDRTLLRSVARSLGESARALTDAYEELEHRHFERIPMFGPKFMHLVEELICSTEDAAETAALGSCEEFAATVSADVSEALQAHQNARA